MDNYLLYRQLKGFVAQKWIKRNQSVLVTCGGLFDYEVLTGLGFTNVTITSAFVDHAKRIPNYQTADAENLPFADQSFDIVLVHAGLHHCFSPHRALCEMYRVARKAVIVIEAQDSWFVRLMVRWGLMLDYEFDAVENEKTSGGVANLPIPNYVYRWTKREVEKLVRSLDPYHAPHIWFTSAYIFYDCFLQEGFFLGKKAGLRSLNRIMVGRVAHALTAILNVILPSQGNTFTMLIFRHKLKVQPWLRHTTNGYRYLTKNAKSIPLNKAGKLV